MNLLKKLLAFSLCALMIISFSGCHKKNEVAVTVDGIEFTSAYYSCALIFADLDAKAILDEDAKEGETVDYYKKKIDGKKFEEYVKDEAISYLKNIANYKKLCKENKLEIDSGNIAYAESMASYYWDSMGYSKILSENGVSLDTFKNYMADTYYADEYFRYLYGAEGPKAISADELKNALSENYILVNMIEKSISDLSEDELKTEKAKFEGYVSSINKGSKTFSEIYLAENTEDIEDSNEEEKPADKYGQVISAEDTAYASDYYESVKEMAVGEAKLITLEDESAMAVIVKKDISTDSYYLESLDSNLRSLIAGESYKEEMEKSADKLKADINKSAVNRFKVKNIKYPES